MIEPRTGDHAPTPAPFPDAIAVPRKRAWAPPALVRHASLTVLTQHASLGTFSMLFQGIGGSGQCGFGCGVSPMRRRP
ncbi:MAG TPA: hypothetical protein VF041_21890 [Gemmatimonadaceae bacterium]